jgi:hypothetical protein
LGDTSPKGSLSIGIFNDCAVSNSVERRDGKGGSKGCGNLLRAEVPEGGWLFFAESHKYYYGELEKSRINIWEIDEKSYRVSGLKL